MTVANGEALEVKGRIKVRLQLGSIDLQVPMVIVKGIFHEVILGSGFFKSNGCTINYDMGTLSVKDSVILIHLKKSTQLYAELA